MDQKHKQYVETLHIGHVRPEDIPWRRLGQYLYRILEDGSQTQMRLCMIESLIPPRSDGPVFHFHEMHDEGFIVTVSNAYPSGITSSNIVNGIFRRARSASTPPVRRQLMPRRATSSLSRFVFPTNSATPSTKKASSSTRLLQVSL
ncbi:conserved hypothetical protein [Talaromyces stipitatus ATCC 10500]|uniref:Uncharacterized protein n=1 Tax=Talaromyces stipitatus (strain ATCC 10500 / CBS 375.48 / QM 6759 / NRRL 1006) TaxID=441959 RepID=B8MFZ3_TALSN|nr:uncharacterized protein TSTA_009790 [Talaromyces stipitatus ATCC 10500]EED15861.1 conserved hypothetical protein [Talaromyces stipitatus ATCC 10500]